MEEDNRCSGNIKLRIPKTLHQKLIDSAKREGVSLNQYCVHVLSDKMSVYMGREDFNRELSKIKNNSSDSDIEELTQKLKPLFDKINVYKELIKLEDFNNTNYLSIQDEMDLELKYPVLINRESQKQFTMSIKIPTIKMIIEPKNDNCKIMNIQREIDDKICELKGSDSIFLSIGNIDDINFTHSNLLDFKRANSLIVNVLNEDLDIIKNKFLEINSLLTNLECSDEFVIRYAPAYLLSKMKNK